MSGTDAADKYNRVLAIHLWSEPRWIRHVDLDHNGRNLLLGPEVACRYHRRTGVR